MISLQNYELHLSSQTKIYFIFNIYDLKPHYKQISDTISGEELPSDIIEDIKEWKVEKIIGEQQEKYLVRWKEYPETI